MNANTLKCILVCHYNNINATLSSENIEGNT